LELAELEEFPRPIRSIEPSLAALLVRCALTMQVSEKIKHEQNDQNEAEAAPSARASPVSITAAAEYQEKDNDDNDETHAN
jgi:hypothetical protein